MAEDEPTDASIIGKKSPAGKDASNPEDRELAKQTFVTGLGVEASGKKQRQPRNYRLLEATNAGPRIIEHHKDLTNLALCLDQRMEALLMEHEKDFFLAYKTHMYSVQAQIKSLRMKADHEDAKTREDTKIRALEGELDWFMTEALRLDDYCKGYKKEVDKWKAKAEALDEDRRFLEDQIKGAKRQNKILRAAAERARSSVYSAMLVTRSKTEAQDRGTTTLGGGGLLALSNSAQHIPPAAPGVKRRPASAGGAIDYEGRKPNREERSLTPDVVSQANSLSSSTGALLGRVPGHKALSRSGSLPSIGPAQTRVLGTEAEERYVEAIQHLKESIARERQNVRMLQASRATSFSKKGELEELFLKCMDEARRDHMKKRHITKNKEKSERERVLEAMLSNEDVLVCLYEKLFPHRTGIARSLGANNGMQDAQVLNQPLDAS